MKKETFLVATRREARTSTESAAAAIELVCKVAACEGMRDKIKGKPVAAKEAGLPAGAHQARSTVRVSGLAADRGLGHEPQRGAPRRKFA